MALDTAFVKDLYDFNNEITDPEPLVIRGYQTGRSIAYYARLDRMYTSASNQSGSEQPWGFCDPMFNNGAKPITDFSQEVTSAQGGLGAFVVGEWNRSLDTQKIYSLTGIGATGRLEERHHQSFEINDDDPFPLFRNTCQEVGNTVDGYYVAYSLDYLVFETEQKIIMPQAFVRYDGATRQYVACEVDLTTGLGTPIDWMPGRAGPSPNEWNEPPIFGDLVNWRRIQFVEDDDSTHLTPKGYFFVSEQEGHSPTIADDYAYVRKIEWNPAEISGSPRRVHKRITLTSRVEFDETIIGWPFSQSSLVVHPLSQRIYWVINDFNTPDIPGTSLAYIFGTVPSLTDITAAAPESTPRTAGTTAFNVEALGSLGEKIPGVSVEFSLEGASTLLEHLDTSAGVDGAAVAVVYIPIDDDTGLEVWEIPAGESLTLLDPSNYTVNYTTGVITGVDPHWKATSVYYATYNHKTNTDTPTAAPAHGTLLTPIVTTDSYGKARTRIRYPDNDDLVLRYDNLKAETI